MDVSMDVEQRENALASLFAARDFMRSHPNPRNAAHKRILDATIAPAIDTFLAFGNAGGAVPFIDAKDPEAAVARLIDYLTEPAGQGDGPMGSMVFPSRGAAGTSLGAAFIEARQRRLGSAGSGVGFMASVLETGSTAVSVPLRPEPITDPRRARFLFELLREQDAPNGTYSFMQQTERDLQAAVVARGDRKPTSVFKMQKVPGETKTIAHLSEPIHRFDLSDAPMLRRFIDDEMAFGVNLALDGVVYDAITDVANVEGSNAALADIRAAITSLQKLELVPDAIAMSPQTWEDVESEALTTFAANSNAPAATEAMARRLFGIPVAVSNAVDEGVALVGDFAGSAELYFTGGVQIDVSDSIYLADAGDGQPGSTFEQNTLVFRAERRADVAMLRPAGFILVGAGT